MERLSLNSLSPSVFTVRSNETADGSKARTGFPVHAPFQEYGSVLSCFPAICAQAERKETISMCTDSSHRLSEAVSVPSDTWLLRTC